MAFTDARVTVIPGGNAAPGIVIVYDPTPTVTSATIAENTSATQRSYFSRINATPNMFKAGHALFSRSAAGNELVKSSYTALCHSLVELDVTSSTVVQAPTTGEKHKTKSMIISQVLIMFLFYHSYSKHFSHK